MTEELSLGNNKDNSDLNNNKIKLKQNLDKAAEKYIPIVKIGKDIYIYRTLYLIAKDSLFKDKQTKNLKFYLKSEIKPKSLLHVPKPGENDIIIENIRELIEIILSLCSLTNTSNYKISLFSSYFENIQNNSQLMKYQGKVLYAKLNELQIKLKENIEENKISKTFNRIKNIKYFKKVNNSMNKTKQQSQFPSIPRKQLGLTVLFDTNKKSNKTNSFKSKYQNINILGNKINEENNMINININTNENTTNKINTIDNENALYQKSFFPKSHSMYSQQEKNMTIKSNFMTNEPLSETMLKKSNSDFSGNVTTTYRFPPKKLKIFFNDINRNSSEEMTKNNSMQNLKIKGGKNRTRNKLMKNIKKLESQRLTSFFKEKKSFFDNHTYDLEKLNKLFFIDNKYKKENILLELAKKNQRKIKSIKLIQNFLNQPSLIKSSSDIFNSIHIQKLDSIKISFFSFKKILLELSKSLNDYILDTTVEKFIPDIDDSFKSLGINLNYCLKEYFLYTYFDKCLNDAYPEIKSKNIIYDKKTKPEYIKNILIYLLDLAKNLKEKNKYDLVNYIRNIKNINKCELTSDFFLIFVFCPNYFQLSKREIAKKFLLVLEIDCVKDKVSISNFINYYHIFRYGHLVTTEQRILFINKLLHLIEVKGDLLQNKITSDIEYLFKIDKRTKHVLLGKVYDLKLNFHQTLKVNEIFDSINKYFNAHENKIYINNNIIQKNI